MRQLTRRMAAENWTFERQAFELDEKGVGHAVLTAHGPERAYSLVVFAHDLPPEMRSDRVIATAWDATFTLYDGSPDKQDIERLSNDVPLQEAGRVDERCLSVSRANRSVRLWDHVVDALARGEQPDENFLQSVGYLMRTTAVYGSGKLGAADREMIATRPEFSLPFQVEMLSVYLTRWFVRELVEHMARMKGGARATTLDDEAARSLGIGNSTGLGMAPFLINHPILFNNWVTARETALARVRAVKAATSSDIAAFQKALTGAGNLIRVWTSQHPLQIAKLAMLKSDLAALQEYLDQVDLTDAQAWNTLYLWGAENLSLEGQELLVSLLLEPYGPLVDDLGANMSDNSGFFALDGSMSVARALDLLRDHYGWALDIDWSAKEAVARAWYVSEEKLEPRLGERFEEPIADYEQPLAPGRDAAEAHHALSAYAKDKPLAAFLKDFPQHRHILRRAQIVADHPFGEIRDNTISADLMPIDMLRAKLSFFGVTQFDPRSDRWVRVNMYAGAPYPQDLSAENADMWVYPGAI